MAMLRSVIFTFLLIFGVVMAQAQTFECNGLITGSGGFFELTMIDADGLIGPADEILSNNPTDGPISYDIASGTEVTFGFPGGIDLATNVASGSCIQLAIFINEGPMLPTDGSDYNMNEDDNFYGVIFSNGMGGDIVALPFFPTFNSADVDNGTYILVPFISPDCITSGPLSDCSGINFISPETYYPTMQIGDCIIDEQVVSIGEECFDENAGDCFVNAVWMPGINGDCECSGEEASFDISGSWDCSYDCETQTTTVTYEVIFNDGTYPAEMNLSLIATAGGVNVIEIDSTLVFEELLGENLILTQTVENGDVFSIGSTSVLIDWAGADDCSYEYDNDDSFECTAQVDVDTDLDGVCDDMDCEPNDNTIAPGISCDDEDNCTINDVYDQECLCAGTAIDFSATIALNTDDCSYECTDDGLHFNYELVITVLNPVENVFVEGTINNETISIMFPVTGAEMTLPITDVTNLPYLTYNLTISDAQECDVAAGDEEITCGDISIIDLDDDGIFMDVDCDDCDANIGLPGASCDDGDPCTENDMIDENCECTGTLIDSDDDGICDEEDCEPEDPLIGQGLPCDDENACTTNDAYNEDCECIGDPLPDSDDDGICDEEDCEPEDPMVGEGLPCDDENACTTNDAYNEDCECIGDPLPDSDDDGICDEEDCEPEDPLVGQGLPCDDENACTSNDAYNEDCECIGDPLPDEDDDGICDEEDCDPTDPLIGSVGDACDDGNEATLNDVLNEDCECIGESLYPPIVIQIVEINCDLTTGLTDVEILVLGGIGEGDYSVNDEPLAYNPAEGISISFTDLLDGELLEINVMDSTGNTASLEYTVNCIECNANAILSTEIAFVCDGDSGIIIPIEMSINSDGIVANYVLHSNESNPGDALVISMENQFSLTESLVTNTEYFVSVVIGPDENNDGLIDENETFCFVSNAQPIIFLNPIEIVTVNDLCDLTVGIVTSTYHITGGMPEYDLNSNYGVIGGPTSIGYEQQFDIATTSGDAYTLLITDDANCNATFISSDFSECPKLAIEEIEFTGKTVDEGIALEWTTYSEYENDYFIVEHSTDGIDFEAIGTVDGSGTTTTFVNYEFLHDRPVSGDNYYRLKYVDFNGFEEFSNTIVIIWAEETEFVLLANLVKQYIPINNQMGSAVTLDIYNIAGANMQQLSVPFGISQIQVKHWPNGIYILHYQSKTTQGVMRFVKE